MYFKNSFSISLDFNLSSYFDCFKNLEKELFLIVLRLLTICFDLVPKSLYSFVCTSEEILCIILIST